MIGSQKEIKMIAYAKDRLSSLGHFWNEHRRTFRTNLVGYLFVLPTVVFLAIFIYQPAISVIYHSFFRWDGFGVAHFTGVRNYIKLIQDPDIHIAVRNLLWFFIGWMLQRVSPFLVAELVFNLKNARAKYWYRTLFVIPMVVPGLVMMMIWKFIYNPMPNIGMLNRLLGVLGLERFQRAWLADTQTVIPALLFVWFPWVSGWAFMIFYAGLRRIPADLLDAAVIDGCSIWRRIIDIDIPLCLTSIRLIAIQTMIGTIQQYAFVLIMTMGGPAKASLVPGLALYLNAFRGDYMGYGAAIGVTMFVVVLVLTLLSFRYTASPFE